MEKRGLSNLIATVLIVLLALAAVAIVWSFIRPPLEDAGRSIGLGTKCLESEAKPTSCVQNSTTNVTKVMVQHSKGQDVSDVLVVVDFEDESSGTNNTGPLELFATRTFTVNPTSPAAKAKTAGAVSIVSDGEGNTEVCEESIARISCTIA